MTGARGARSVASMRNHKTVQVIAGAALIAAVAARPLTEAGFPVVVLLAATTIIVRRRLCPRRGAAWVAGVLSVAVGLGAASAQASSIVYINGGNVWLANPDGSGARKVSTGGGYTSPSQADDGTIVAAHGSSNLVRMDRHGHQLPGPGVPPTPGGSGPLDPRISPDGSKVVFHWVAYACDFCGGTMRTGTQITWADHATPAEEFGYQRPDTNPSWISNSRLLLFGSGADVVDLGTGPDRVQEWFNDSEYIPIPDNDIYYEGEVTRAGDKIALGGGVTDTNTPSARIRFFSANGAFPAKPTARCQLNDPTDAFTTLTWSPDGSQLAFEDAEGIWVMPVNLDDCSSLRPTLAVPGGRQPDWGPPEVGTANVDTPPCTAGSGCASPHGGNGHGTRGLRLRGLSVVPRRFRAARGARIRFQLSRSASVTLRVARSVHGHRRRVNGSLRRRGVAGANRMRFAARIGGRRLAPGRYRLTAIARAHGRRSTPASTSFTVVR